MSAEPCEPTFRPNTTAGSQWEPAGKDLKREFEFKYYRLTPPGKKQLMAEESKWKKLTGAVARILWAAEER